MNRSPIMRRLPTINVDRSHPWWEASSGILLVVLVALTFQATFHLMRTVVALPTPRSLRRGRPGRRHHTGTQHGEPVEAPAAAASTDAAGVAAAVEATGRRRPWSRQPRDPEAPIDAPASPPVAAAAPVEAEQAVARPVTGSFAAWHYPAFVAGLALSIVATAAYFAYWTFQGWTALQLGTSTFEVVALASIAGVPAVVFMTLGRPLADPVNNRGWVFTFRVIVVAILGWMALAASQNALTLPAFVASSALLGATWCFDMPARYCGLPATVPARHAANARAWQFLVQAAALACAPIVAASVIQASGMALILVIAAGANGFVALGLYFVRARDAAGDVEFEVAAEEKGALDADDAQTSKLPLRAGLVILPGLAAGAVLALGPLIARDIAHTDVVGYGWLLGATGMGATLGLLVGFAAGAGRLGLAATLAGLAGLVSAVFLLAYAASVEGTLLLFGGMGLAGGAAAGATFRARVPGTTEQLRLASTAVAPWAAVAPAALLAGMVAERAGLPFAIWAIGVAMSAGMALLLAAGLVIAAMSTLTITDELGAAEGAEA